MKVKRNKFDKVMQNLTTMKAGYWYPIFVRPTLPGDKWDVSVADVMRSFARVAPTFANESVRIAGFYVENRLLMDDWWTFRTGGKDNTDTTSLPYMLHSHAKGDVGFGTLTDMLNTAPALTFYTPDGNGVLQANTKVGKSVCLAERAYAKIGQDWLMNQNIEDESDYPLSTDNGDNGEDTTTNRQLFPCHWNRDFWTNQYNSQQKGPEAIIPIGSTAPVSVFGATKADGHAQALGLVSAASYADSVDNLIEGFLSDRAAGSSNAHVLAKYNTTTPAGGVGANLQDGSWDGTSRLVGVSKNPKNSGLTGLADLSQSTGIPISVINLAVAGQKVANMLLRHGSRSVEWLDSMFGVKSSDARLDRSSFLGSYSTDFVISPVNQTSSTDATSPQGNQAGLGFHQSVTPSFRCYCEEDGWFMILACIRPKTMYCQGLPAYHNYKTRYDYPLPAFNHLDYTTAKNSEIYYQGVDGGDDSTDWDSKLLDDNKDFGFHPIYQEWRSFPSEVHGQFLSTLKYWHEARMFDNLPALNKTFIQVGTNAPTRQFAVVSGDPYQAQFAFKIRLKRKLSKFGNPKWF